MSRPITQRPAPSPMGERLLSLMSANYVIDRREFAEGVIGIPAEELDRWIYERISPDELPLRPLIRCADVLGTNAEYLTCISDDPRPGFTLTYDEAVLVQAFRDIVLEKDREQLLRQAQELAHRGGDGEPSHAQPYPRVPLRRPPGAANET